MHQPLTPLKEHYVSKTYNGFLGTDVSWFLAGNKALDFFKPEILIGFQGLFELLGMFHKMLSLFICNFYLVGKKEWGVEKKLSFLSDS